MCQQRNLSCWLNEREDDDEEESCIVVYSYVDPVVFSA